MEDIKITLVCAAYNVEEYIYKCLMSIERQTSNNFKVVIINDCSADSTDDIIRDFIKSSHLDIKYIQNEKNLGVSGSWEKGILCADTEWMYIVDADDVIHPQLVERGLKAISEIDNKLSVVTQKVIGFRNDEEISFMSFSDEISMSITEGTSEQKFCQHSVAKTFFSKELLDIIDYSWCKQNWPRHFMDDGLFSMLLCDKAEAIVKIEEPLYFYRLRNESAGSSIKDYGHIKSWTESNDELIRICKERDYRNLYKNQVVGQMNQIIKQYCSMFITDNFSRVEEKALVEKFKTYYEVARQEKMGGPISNINWFVFRLFPRIWKTIVGNLWYGYGQRIIRSKHEVNADCQRNIMNEC